MSIQNLTDLFAKHIPDYITVFILFITTIFVTPLSPTQRYVNIYDSRIQYPYQENQLDKVPDFWCVFYGMILPLIVICGMELLKVRLNIWSIVNSKTSLYRVHGLLLAFFTTTFVNSTILVFLKMWISQPRPDFISRCQVNSNLIKAGIQVYRISEICMNPNKSIVEEGLRSTPSGHSAISFAGLNFLSLYLFSQFRHTASSTTEGLNMPKLFIGYSPLYLATYIATSRLSDYKHSLFDISFGSTIGVIISISVWKYFDKKSVADENGNEQHHAFSGEEEERQPILPV